MKIGVMTAMMAMTVSLAHGELGTLAAGRTVTVCVPGDAPQMRPGALLFAESLASKVFADVGVTIKWKYGRSGCPAQGILIDISYNTSRKLAPGALAYAFPFQERSEIQIFYDRIRSDHTQSQVGIVLAYVLAHEITHILQGAARHSATGIMKAHWTSHDFAVMDLQALHFERADLDWIESGLEWRAERHTAVAAR